MIKLIKYELLRRKQLLIGAAISALFVEGIALLGIYMGSGRALQESLDGWNILAIMMTVLLVVGGCVLTFLDAVAKLYSDFKQKHGYMIFMTPQNGYRVIWAKTVFAVLEMIAAGIVIGGCLALSGTLADNLYNGAISSFFYSIKFGWGFIAGSVGLGVLQLMAQLSIAFLAVTVSRAIMRSGSYNWLIALVMYFALAMIVNMADGILLLAFGVIGDIMSITNDTVLFNSGLFVKYFIIGAITYSAWFAGCTLLSGRLVNRGIDL
jgi:hypothetical protein